MARPSAAATPRAAPSGRRPDLAAVAVAATVLLFGLVFLHGYYGWRQASLYLTGGALGLVLYHASFGFTSAWRRLLTMGDGSGFRAQLVMLGIASLVFFPVLAGGSFFGRPVVGAVAPVGLSVLVGAFLFGIGMQLGGGCASGTLFAVGGGSPRMVVTLAAFVAGATFATLHMPWWVQTPSLGEVSLVDRWGAPAALALQFAIFAALFAASHLWQRVRMAGQPPAPPPPRHVLFGPWPVLWGAVGLALLNVLTLYLAGHPWSITFGFSLWGAKILSASGVDVAGWEFWQWPGPAAALGRSIFADVTSVMNVGIVAGAVLAAGLAGAFAPVWRVPIRSLAAALLGGLLLGYGARLAYGCNIGAFFSGVASGSLHGWLWLVAALAGNCLGVRFRPAFGLAN